MACKICLPFVTGSPNQAVHSAAIRDEITPCISATLVTATPPVNCLTENS